jgi:hypothetical protein
LVSPVAGAVGCSGFFSGAAPEEPDAEPAGAAPVEAPAPAAEELSLFGASLDVLAEPEAAEPSDFFSVLAEEEPPAAEPSDFLSAFAAELPPAAEPLTPRADRVCWSIWPEALRPFEVWNSFRPFWVFGPIMPST